MLYKLKERVAMLCLKAFLKLHKFHTMNINLTGNPEKYNKSMPAMLIAVGSDKEEVLQRLDHFYGLKSAWFK
jgi:hypothetical protein